MKPKGMLVVAGVMSGTSADGINVALVRVGDTRGGARQRSGTASRAWSRDMVRGHECPGHSVKLLGHVEFPYAKQVRSAVLGAMNAGEISVAELARLNFLLGELYADAVLSAQRRFRVKTELVGCHGQTLYHQGEAATIAARVGVPVVSDFRPADMAVGGKGAPLVPFLDYLLFADSPGGRVVQNIGGIANLTAIPAGAAASEVVAFDTGPGNMVMDAVTEELFGRPYDRGGKIAASGDSLDRVIDDILRRSFFRKAPPKAAGREEFGREFVREFLQSCGRARKQDVVATATTLTARSIADAVRFVVKASPGGRKQPYAEMILSGGGAKNPTLVRMLSNELASVGIKIRFSDEFGLPSEAKEAVAFAMLAYETWHRRPSNLPSATGAKRAAVLGKISYP
jgi:anhydro-N-acetylmuramic acid kinase